MNNAKKSGFSLLELLIALAIVGILAGIVYPSYSAQLTRAHRATVATALVDIAARLEQYYALNNQYSGANLANLGVNDAAWRDYYQITLDLQTDAYVARATPIGAQATADQLCQVLSLDQDGSRSISGPGKLADCW